MAMTGGPATSRRQTSILVSLAAILAILMLLKFVIVKPIMFLGLAILFGIAAFLVRRGSGAGRGLLLLLLLATAVIFGAHVFDKGLDADAYQNTTDYVVILLGLPLALIGLVILALTMRDHPSRSEVSA